MAVPSPVARQDPIQEKLKNGYRALITPHDDPNISFYEIETGLPGLMGPPLINTSTQHNDTVQTFAPGALVTMEEFTCRVAYNPILYDEIIAMLNDEQALTNTFPNGGTLTYWGVIRGFKPDGLVNGTFPTAALTVGCTNVNPSTGAEELFSYITPSGTA